MELKELLNKEQYEAAITIEGPLLILAGAGSGKTRVLTYRIAHMVEDLNIYPSQILAITFTNKAGQEMRERVRSLIGETADNMWISTFHSSCVRILRREIDKLGYKKSFTIYDSYDQKSLVKQCMEELNINDKDITENEIISKIGKAKDNLVTASTYKRENESNFRENKIAEVYELYQSKLKSNNALDFDDLIFKTVDLFNAHPEVLEFYQKKFKYIMIDEYQDTNKCQYEFVRLLAKENRNLCVVGDDDQCIYEWRGADIRNILDFEKDYPDAKVIKLEENYRSMENILNAANTVISNNSERKNKILRTSNEKGEKLKVYRAYSDMDEAQFISSEIKRMMKEEEKTYKDFAILYRTNAQSRIFEDIFMRADIPYRIIGGLKFYDRKEIKDIMAYLKFINNPEDEVSLRRIINVPKRNIGDTTCSKLQEFSVSIEDDLYNVMVDAKSIPGLTQRNINAILKFTDLMDDLIDMKEQLSVSKFIEYILNESGYIKELEKTNNPEDKSRVENLKELVSAAVEFERSSEDKSLSAFLEKTTLVSDIDNFDKEADTLVLMTVHSAKGLEFPVVFMVGMENGIFPGNASLNDPKEMEESRRLCYVGITRAKEKLYMTSAEVRRVFGRAVSYSQSDFIDEINPELVDHIKVKTLREPKKRTKAKAEYNPHSLRADYSEESFTNALNRMEEKIQKGTGELLTKNEATIGRKIEHSRFGVGTIINTLEEDDDLKITIAFDNMGVKQFILSLTPLQLL